MIDKKYLEDGFRIRKESENALVSINLEEKKLRVINDNIKKITSELEVISKNLESYNSPEEVRDEFFGKLNDIEVQSMKLNKTLDPLNDKMEALRKEEEQLWNTVRERYPDVSEDDIIKQFQKYITNKN